MSLIIDRILRPRILKQNKNALIVILGDTGSSKSYDGIGVCLAFDPTFNSKRIAHMTGESFMEVLTQKGLRRGKAIMWDDVGKGLKAREFQELINRIITDILQTFRIKGLLVIFTVPDISFVDSIARKLFHYQMETVTIDYKNKYAICKFFRIQVNRRSGEAYHKYPMIVIKGEKKWITRFKIKIPPKELIKEYEKDKRKAYKKLEIQTKKTIQKIEERTFKKLMGDKEIISDVIRRTDDFMKTYNKRTFIDQFLVMSEYDVGRARANKIKSAVEDKLNIK